MVATRLRCGGHYGRYALLQIYCWDQWRKIRRSAIICWSCERMSCSM